MDFEQNRRNLLAHLQEMKKQKTGATRQAAKRSASRPASAAGNAPVPPAQRKPVIVFCKKSRFLDSLLGALAGKYTAHPFENADLAVDFALDNNVRLFVLDLDEPTDWRLATDVFTTVRTMNPDAFFVICSQYRSSPHLDPLVAKGALALRKPISVEELREVLR